MEICKEKSVAFTGYRSAKIFASAGVDDDNTLVMATIRERLNHCIYELANAGYNTFLSGMADGFDMLAAEQVVCAQAAFPGLRLIAVIPFPQQRDDLSTNNKARYDAILQHAHAIVTIAESYHVSHYFKRNDYLVDHCSHLVCYYDGQGGGTRYTVQRARSRSIAISNMADSQSHMCAVQQSLF